MEEENADSDEALVDPGGEDSEILADEVYMELDDRQASCDGSYPFSLNTNYLASDSDAVNSPYTFMLLLSMFGNRGPADIDSTKLFEDLSSEAALSYFGGRDGLAGLFPFGAPRRNSPASFAEAVDDLCRQLGEGTGLKRQLNLKDQQDAKLDLVVWKRFPDRRAGQLIGFGQCATGQDWKNKVSELRPDAFCKAWMRDAPAVFPISLFFVPFRIGSPGWQVTSYNGGIIFDRCRISHHLKAAPADLLEQCGAWSKHVLIGRGAL